MYCRSFSKENIFFLPKKNKIFFFRKKMEIKMPLFLFALVYCYRHFLFYLYELIGISYKNSMIFREKGRLESKFS